MVTLEIPRPEPACSPLDDDPLVGSLLLDVAHELRSPLFSFSLALAGLSEGNRMLTEQEQSRLIGALQRSAVHLQTLVENILDTASLGADRFSVVLQEIDLMAVLREAVLVVEPLLGPRGQRIAVDAPYDTLTVHADAQRLRQALINLLHNAIKYGPPDDVIILRARVVKDVMIEVSDRGPGIPLEEPQRLFERFFRGRAVSGASPGSGLGLSITRAIVQAHGGEIAVRSLNGVGTTFWFTLRLG